MERKTINPNAMTFVFVDGLLTNVVFWVSRDPEGERVASEITYLFPGDMRRETHYRKPRWRITLSFLRETISNATR